MRFLIFIMIIPIIVSGCNSGGIGSAESPAWHMTATAEQKSAYFRQQCLDFGYLPNTPQLTQCIQYQTNQSRQSANEMLSATMAK